MKRIIVPILLALALAVPAGLRADEASLEKLVAEEKAAVEDPAVSVYGGMVGNAEAVFFIKWEGTGSPVEGRYYYPLRGKNVMYILKGSNPKPGVLELEEFLADGTGELVANAKCELWKRVSDDRIVWEGEKSYENGHLLSISFARSK